MSKDKKKPAGVGHDGRPLYKPSEEQYDTLRSIVEVHSEYLLESFLKSIAVLETRISIAEAMEETKEIVYYTGALEQSKVFVDMVLRSIDELEDWCGVKTVGESNVVDVKKSKRIKRIPVTEKGQSVKKKQKPIPTRSKPKPKKKGDKDG